MTSYSMIIDGKQVQGSKQLDVVNPANEAVFAQVPDCSRDQLETALTAAQRAFGEWRRDENARRAALARGADLLEANAEQLIRTLTQEQGKPLIQAKGEVMSSIIRLKETAEMPIPHETTVDDNIGRIDVYYRPHGVVAGITPWNFPFQMAVNKLAPALLAGNTMVLKPSPYTPLTSLLIGRYLNEVLPPGVLNVVSGGNDLGAQLTSHPLVRMISFTGSVPTGKAIARTAAGDLKRVCLELGGNDPAIVLDDVDPAKMGSKLFWAAFTNCGQVCLAVKRVYVPEALYEPIVAAVAQKANAAKVGDGMEPDTQVGPLNNLMQLEKVAAMVADAKSRGAVIRTGGERIQRKGFFYTPTILTDVDDTMEIVAEEQFGPALPILPYRHLDEAIAQANATQYGLGASIWSSNLDRAAEAAKEIDAGTVWVNQHMVLTKHAPFGGTKWSGIGESMGRWGLEAFLQKRVVSVRRG